MPGLAAGSVALLMVPPASEGRVASEHKVRRTKEISRVSCIKKVIRHGRDTLPAAGRNKSVGFMNTALWVGTWGALRGSIPHVEIKRTVE
ncbi:hypothetical protein MT1_2476 [Pseudomonas sp. MT-1]|nr:hypothetical protein MT1_2476 [Pseudomonas sp. MT-1]